MAEQNLIPDNVQDFEIFAFSHPDNPVNKGCIEWSETVKLFETYYKEKGFFEDQDEEWRTAFSRHCDLYGFAYFCYGNL